VRFTTDRLREQGVVAGAEGVTSYRIGEGIWKVRVFGVSGDYVDARASDFEVIRGGTRPRGVVIPSINGGWLTITPVHSRPGQLPAIWDVPRTFQPGDFAGMLTLSTTDDSYGFPVIWSREEQLKLVYFFELPDRIDSNRRRARKAAELKITLRSPTHRTLPEFSGVLVVDAVTASIASDWLVDLFPSVTPDDIDPV
jgi:hypothetical protein